MFGLGPIELILTGALSLGLIVFGGVYALVFISKRPAKRTVGKS